MIVPGFSVTGRPAREMSIRQSTRGFRKSPPARWPCKQALNTLRLVVPPQTSIYIAVLSALRLSPEHRMKIGLNFVPLGLPCRASINRSIIQCANSRARFAHEKQEKNQGKCVFLGLVDLVSREAMSGQKTNDDWRSCGKCQGLPQPVRYSTPRRTQLDKLGLGGSTQPACRGRHRGR